MADRRARNRSARNRAEAHRSWLMAAPALLLVAIAIIVVLAAVVLPRSETSHTDPSGHAHGGSGTSFEVPEGTLVDYPDWPPTSGPYYAATAGYGVPGRWIDEGYWVHTLAHGATVILYRCDDSCDDLEASLRRAHESFPPSDRWDVVKLLALPTDRIDSPLVLLAWEDRVELEAWDRQRVRDFYVSHLDAGPMDAP